MTTKTSALALMRAYPPMNYLGAPRVAFSPGEEGGDAPAPEKNTEIPVQTSAPETLVVATDEAAEAAAAPEAAVEADATGADAEGKKPPKLPDWAQKEIAKKAFEAREATRRAEAAEAELAKARAKQPAPTATAADAAAAELNAPAGGYASPADFDAAVQAEANRRAQADTASRAQAEFDAACNAVYTKAKSDAAMGEHFDAAIQNLQQVGFMNRDMLDIVLASDDAPKVLYELGADPDRAIALMQMTPAKRAIEIAKMSVPTPAKPTPLSNAPRPIEPVEGSARPNGEPSDNDDDATWFAKRTAQLQRRHQAA